jgi:hypothetical protein
MLHRDSTIQKCFTVRRFSVPCQPSRRSSHPVQTTICHCSIRPDDVPYRQDSRQTKHHPSERRVSPSRPSTVSRRFYPACIHPDVSVARPDASLYSISFRFLSKFQEREDRSTVRMMWYPVRTRDSLRQESQFKYHRPDVWQLWSGRAFIKVGNCQFDFNRPDDCLSWSGRAHCRYGNCVLKNSRPDAQPPWFGHAKPYKEITCSGCATVRTMCHLV